MMSWGYVRVAAGYVRSLFLSQSVCVSDMKDLTAVGITCPSARKRLKFEISQLDIDDGIPRFLPASINVTFTIPLGQHSVSSSDGKTGRKIPVNPFHLISTGFQSVDGKFSTR